MHYDLVMFTQIPLDTSIFEGFNYLVTSLGTINRDYSITINDQKMSFDYLIIDAKPLNLNLLTEDKLIVTNQHFETSLDNVFAIGTINASTTTINEQIETILNYIQNPF
jgi:thioredoxin reductase